MFNYRMLAEWIYQKNSRRIDLFQGFKKDIFRYLYFSKAYTRIDGTKPAAAAGKTAEEWWDYINKVQLPLTRRGQVIILEELVLPPGSTQSQSTL